MKLRRYKKHKSQLSRDKHKEYALQHHYGISLAEFHQLVRDQDGKCAICFQLFGPTGPHVDHDHVSGKRRSLLCRRCNNGLGFFLDEPAILVAAAKYLLRWNHELRSRAEPDRQGERQSSSEIRATV